MTNPATPPPSTGPKTTPVSIAPQFDKQEYWLVMSATGNDPKMLKREPSSLHATEFCLKLHVLVPKSLRRKVSQTIEVKLPEEMAHLAQIEVTIPDTTLGNGPR